MKIREIVSGGQSGADRAALDVALARRIPYRGWCPHGGWAEDFPEAPGLLARYPNLRETPARDAAQRTRWNVRDSDATLVIAVRGAAGVASPGTALTIASAHALRRPCLVLAVATNPTSNVEVAVDWLSRLGDGLSLNVAGARRSELPRIYAATVTIVGRILDRFEAG